MSKHQAGLQLFDCPAMYVTNTPADLQVCDAPAKRCRTPLMKFQRQQRVVAVLEGIINGGDI